MKINKFTYAPFLSIKDLINILFIKKKDDIEILKLWNKNLFQSALLTYRTSLSLRLICDLKIENKNYKPINIYLPSFYCNSSLEYISNDKNVKIFFYPITENREILINWFDNILINNIPDIIIHVHYFGQYCNLEKIKKISQKNSTWLVEDAAHCSYLDEQIGLCADFTLYSPYKIFPVPTIGILYCNNYGLNKLKYKSYDLQNKYNNIINSSVNILENLFWLCKKILFSFNLRLNYKYEKFIQLPNIVYNHKFSINDSDNFSKRLLYFSLLKKNKYYTFINNLKNIFLEVFENKTKYDIAENIEISYSPYFIILKFANINCCEIFYQKIIKSQLFIVTWPDLPNPILEAREKIYDSTFKLRYNYLYIPVHMSINLNHFKSYLLFIKNISFEDFNKF